MDSIEDDELIDDYDGLDYNVVSRPQELIDQQKKLSKPHMQPDVDKSDVAANRNPFARKQPSKNRDKKSNSRHEKKGSSKEKTSHKSPLNEGSPIKKSAELNKRYETLKKIIQRELGDYSKSNQRSEPLKIQKDEHDSLRPKSKKSNQDKDMNFNIPVSKIMKEPAITAMQRFQALDARDAALRASTSKPEGSKKIIIVGTCPDMCPEKERYGRIAKNCVSVLEMTSTFDSNASSYDADHSRMIKEYSRSSADQQEPLPHELRPVSVLKLTMDYLLCNVIDKYHESVSLEDWYDFIWNRTRSIRKDITQQQLCDPTCVEIIEKCVRFHIHCAEALSEEETAVFDPKINNENLTKCLQTLKHVYEDLQSKLIECPNEAEFRSYDILLSLTEGETLRLIKDIRKDLLKSPLIKAAFEAALAFNSDNYVKFFQIVGKADYLSSCILHRYIIKVRSNALQIIVRAYTTQHNTSLYPISRLVNDLKFENEEEASDFCRCHGLEVSGEFITIGRKQFSKSPSGVPVSRSFLLVGQKIGNNLGMIINNGSLSLNPKDTYEPHNSFDEHNMLKVDCIGAVKEEIEKDLPANKIFEQEDEEMEAEDVLPLPDDSSFQSKTENPLQDTNIAELEKRRTELLEELNEVEFRNVEKQRREHSSKQKEKNKSSKKAHLPSKSHKSVMFSPEVTDIIQPVKKTDDPENLFKPVAVNSSSSNRLKSQTDSSFFKFPSSSSSKAFDLAYASNSGKQFALPKIFATKSDLPVSSTPTTNVFASSTFPSSGFPAQDFGFSFKSTVPASFLSIPFTRKSDDGNVRHLGTDTNPFFRPPILPVSSRHEELNQKSSSSIAKIPNVELGKRIVQEIACTQHLVPEIIIDDSECCNKEVIEEEAEMRAENSICLPDEKVDPLGEEKTISKNNKITTAQEATTESLREDSRKSAAKIIEESNRKYIEESNRKEIEERQKSELINKFVDEIAEEVLFEVVEDCLPSICEEVLDEERRIKAELDNEITKIREQLARNAIFKWHIFVQKRREKRIYENLAFYSPWQAILLNTPRISSGAISPFVAYQKHCSLTKATAEMLKKRFEVPPGWEKFDAEQVWPLSSFKTPYADASYFGSSRIKNFFKLCIVLPHARDSNMTMFKDWICSKFGLQKPDSSKFDCRNVFKLHMGETLIVVRAVELTPDVVVKNAKFLDGVTAMILFVPGDSKDREHFLKNLTTLCDSSVLDSPYPLYLYFMGLHDIPTDMTSYTKMKIELSFTAFNMQCIPDINNFVENSQKVLNGLIWFNELKDKARQLPVLKKVSFRQYVEDAFSYVFSILLCKVSLDEYKFLLEDPQFILNFYNRAMKFRASVLCNDLIKGIHSCWPPEEIKDILDGKFIDMQTQNLCKKALENLLLPDFEGDPYDDITAWEYARLVPSSSSNIVLSIKISDSSVHWVQKIIYCAEHLIQNSDFILTKGDLPVYYVLEDIVDFGCDPYWIDVLAELLPHQNSLKRKVSVPFESCSPLKKSKVGPYQSTPKVYENNFLNIFEDTSDVCTSEKPAKFRYFSDINKPHPIKEICQTAKSTIEKKAFEDPNILNHRLSSMAVGNERKSSEPSHEKLLNSWARNTLTEINKENDILEKISSFKLPSKAVGSERKLSGLSHNIILNTNIKRDGLNVDDDWKDIGVKKPSGNTWSSLADKISELQYNIQRNSILEDHIYDLLNKQL